MKPVSAIGFLSGEDERNNVIAYLQEHARDRASRVALRWVEPGPLASWNGSIDSPLPHEQITYGELEHRIGVTAHGLAELGIGKGDRVVLFLPMGLPMYTAMFALQSLGAVGVFLDSWARRDQLRASIQCVDPVAMISHHRAFELLGEPEDGGPIRVLAGPGDDGSYAARLEELLNGTEKIDGLRPVAGEAPALITFTTGSSGTPKGANRTHRFLSAQHVALERVIPYAESDVDLVAFPIFSLNSLASGVTTLLPALDLADPGEGDAAALACQLLHENVSCATLSPSMVTGLGRFCNGAGVQLPGLRRLVTGGAPISRDDVRSISRVAPNAQVLVLYGSTEVEPMTHIDAVEMLREPSVADPEIVEQGVNVGRIDPGLDFRFLRIERGPIDLSRTPWEELAVEPGEVGEFVVSGDHVCNSYYNDEEAMRRTKIREESGRIWHRTGDLARLDDSGRVWIVGRVHNVVERAGCLYFPVRAEIVLKRVRGVHRAAFLGLPDAALGQRTAVAVELEPGVVAAPAVAEIHRLLEKNGIPIDSLYVLDEIPMDSRHHSKVEYDVLRRRILESEVEVFRSEVSTS